MSGFCQPRTNHNPGEVSLPPQRSASSFAPRRRIADNRRKPIVQPAAPHRIQTPHRDGHDIHLRGCTFQIQRQQHRVLLDDRVRFADRRRSPAAGNRVSAAGAVAGTLTGCLTVFEARNVYEFREGSESALVKDGILLLTSALLLCINAHFVRRKWGQLFERVDSVLAAIQGDLGAAMAFFAVRALGASDWTPLGWARCSWLPRGQAPPERQSSARAGMGV